MKIFIIIWLLLGVISVWRVYFGILKEWYIEFNESCWDYKGGNVLKHLLLSSPIFIAGGLISIILSELLFTTKSWYFRVPKNSIKSRHKS